MSITDISNIFIIDIINVNIITTAVIFWLLPVYYFNFTLKKLFILSIYTVKSHQRSLYSLFL